MKLISGYILCLFFVLSLVRNGYPQYPPPAGKPGTTAIYKDSSVFYAWAKKCTVIRGFVNISDTNFYYNNSNRASYGNVYMATDKPDGLVLSLGDGGIATLTFDTLIADQPGWDFAVFENSFSDSFLELAFVEVSSDGNNFVRFPSVSLTQTQHQVSTFDTLDARKIDNLAGKYRLFYGTPFDLYELKDSAGVNISHITHIRVIDVVGSIQDPWSGFDSQGHRINDPFPTPFDTGGFDLDAVGLLHDAPYGLKENTEITEIRIIPNPCRQETRLFSNRSAQVNYTISNPEGKILLQGSFRNSFVLDTGNLLPGIYLLNFSGENNSFQQTKKLLKY